MSILMLKCSFHYLIIDSGKTTVIINITSNPKKTRYCCYFENLKNYHFFMLTKLKKKVNAKETLTDKS